MLPHGERRSGRVDDRTPTKCAWPDFAPPVGACCAGDEEEPTGKTMTAFCWCEFTGEVRCCLEWPDVALEIFCRLDDGSEELE
jgi:hypothetical protein